MEREIERLCKILVTAINDRDFDYQSPEARLFRTQHVSPDFEGKLDSRPWSISFEEQNDTWRQLTIDYPDIHWEVEGVDCYVHKKERTADAILHSSMLQGDLRLVTACQMKWKFSKGRWQWYQHNGELCAPRNVGSYPAIVFPNMNFLPLQVYEV